MTIIAIREPDLPTDAVDGALAGRARQLSPTRHASSDGRRVLLIEHDVRTAGTVIAALDPSGYQVTVCQSPGTALARVGAVDVILLNLELPELDGPGFLAELRLDCPAAPMLVYSSRQDVDSVVVALQCGADDYLVQPIRPAELVARMKAVSRRAAACCPPERVVRSGDIEIRFNARDVTAGGEPVRLTQREFDVLWALARKAGRPVSRTDIMMEVWGRATLANSRTLDVHMTALRTKLDRPTQLRTVRGFGYRLG